MNTIHKQFEELASDIILKARSNVSKSLSSYTRQQYLLDMKNELKALKDAYAVIFTDADAIEDVFID
jgi:hypothetical protein